MKVRSSLAAVALHLSLTNLVPAMAQTAGDGQPLVLSDAVLRTPSKTSLLDPRIFAPEFYRKFNPSLGLTTDQEAIQQWTSAGRIIV